MNSISSSHVTNTANQPYNAQPQQLLHGSSIPRINSSSAVAPNRSAFYGCSSPSNLEFSPSTIASTFATSPEIESTNSHPAAQQQHCLPVPQVEIKLFVGKVPKSVEDALIRAEFSEFGSVRDVIVIRDRETGAHKGCAFVRMASITQADAAIRQLNNIRVLDTKLGPLQVKYALGEPERLGVQIGSCAPGVDQAKLFVGSLPKAATEEQIHEVFARFGNVDEVFVMRDGDKVSKGCAFVRFAFKEEAFNAIANLNKNFSIAGGTKPIEVRFAENKKFEQHQHQLYDSISPSPSLSPGTRQPPAAAAIHSPSSPTAGWLQYTSSAGLPYYFSLQTGHTQWERPVALGATLAPPSQSPPANVAPGGVGSHTHGPPGANVFIFHIPNDWSEHDLVVKFSPFGQIVSGRIATEKGSGRRLGFGFVSFSRIEAAVNAVQALNGLPVSGKRLKVTIKRGEEQYAGPFLPAELNNRQQRDNSNNSTRSKIQQQQMIFPLNISNASVLGINCSDQQMRMSSAAHAETLASYSIRCPNNPQSQLPFPRRDNNQQQPQYQFNTPYRTNNMDVAHEQQHHLHPQLPFSSHPPHHPFPAVTQIPHPQHHSNSSSGPTSSPPLYYPPNSTPELQPDCGSHSDTAASANFNNFFSSHLYGDAQQPAAIPAIITS